MFFDATQVAPAEGRTLLPNATYRFAITAAELKTTKAGTGKFVSVECTVLEGEHKGRKLWPTFNVQNPSAEAQRIGQEQFSALCHAIGRVKLSQPSDLIGGTFRGDVTIKREKDGTDRNRINRYAVDAGPGSAPVAAPVSAPTKPAWAKAS